MEHRDVFLIEIIIDYCEKIESYLRDNKISQANFFSNPYFQDTCAFYCLQIGENAGNLSELFIERHSEVEWRKIIALRNVIAHEYGAIDLSLLWDIINKNIPGLLSACKKIIGVNEK